MLFSIKLKDKKYILRAKDIEHAEMWIGKLNEIRSDALALSIPEEGNIEESEHKIVPTISPFHSPQPKSKSKEYQNLPADPDEPSREPLEVTLLSTEEANELAEKSKGIGCSCCLIS